MNAVMTHTVQWINSNPTKVAERDNNKPMLRMDFVPGLQKKYGEEAEEKSKVLEEKVLQYVRDNICKFKAPTIEHFILEYPEDTDIYRQRFEHTVWEKLRSTVLDFAGPIIRQDYIQDSGTSDLLSEAPEPSSAIIQAVYETIYRLPVVSQNPALQSPTARKELQNSLKRSVFTWALEACDKGLKHRDEWDQPTQDLVQRDQSRFQELLAALDSDSQEQPTPSPSPARIPGQDGNETSPAHRLVRSPVLIEPTPKPPALLQQQPLDEVELGDTLGELPKERPSQQARVILQSLSQQISPKPGPSRTSQRPLVPQSKKQSLSSQATKPLKPSRPSWKNDIPRFKNSGQ